MEASLKNTPAPEPGVNPLTTAEPWNLVADAYTTELVPQFEPFAYDALRLAALPQSPEIVDVAAGPGTLALLAAHQGARVSAIDLSPAMIRNLLRRAESAGLRSIDARMGDGQLLPYSADSFDGGFSIFGLMFFPDRKAAFRELLRVLRPGARAVVSSWAPAEGPFPLALETMRNLLPQLALPRGLPPLSDPELFRLEMSDAGFHEVRVHALTHLFTAPSVPDFWASVQRTAAPIALAARSLGPERWDGVSRAILERLRRAYGSGRIEAPVTAYLGVGKK